MTSEELWLEYCAATGTDRDAVHSAWQFGGAPDKLAALVLSGRKRATSSVYRLYFMSDGEPLPRVGDLSVILDSHDRAVCVIRTDRADVVRYADVTPEFAACEGEGDLSLGYWRDVHRDFFTGELAPYGLALSDDTEILCERFSVVYAPRRVALETERLVFREYVWGDAPALSRIICDPETMKYYAKPYDESGVYRWIEWNLENYEKYGFGLFALELKETGEFIGDCGITLQKINGRDAFEIGYHVDRRFQRRGYATEAARACRDYIFEETGITELYSYMNAENLASRAVAEKNGMRFVEEYRDGDMTLAVYRIGKER